MVFGPRWKSREAQTEIVGVELPHDGDVEIARGLRGEIAPGIRDQVEGALVEEPVHHAPENKAVGRRVGISAANHAGQVIPQGRSQEDGDKEPEHRVRVFNAAAESGIR